MWKEGGGGTEMEAYIYIVLGGVRWCGEIVKGKLCKSITVISGHLGWLV